MASLLRKLNTEQASTLNPSDRCYDYIKKSTFIKAIVTICVLMSNASHCNADQNVDICLSGKFPALCDKSKLSEKQRNVAVDAEKKQNLATCLSGKFPSLCRRNLLSTEELTSVSVAEIRENYVTCKSGRYPSLCKHELLTEKQADQVQRAEKSENLKICMAAKYKSLCKHHLLSEVELKNVQAREAAEDRKPQTSKAIRKKFQGVGCEGGHWIDSVIDDGRIVKLEDGTVWQVDSIDQIYSMLWLPVSDIVVCDDKLINIDDDEAVNARRLR